MVRASLLLLILLTTAAIGAGPAERLSKGGNSFGIKPEWVSSPEMLDTLNRLHTAGLVEGRRGTLTFFRWSNTEPPRLAHLGLWGAKIGNKELQLGAALSDLENVSIYETGVDDEGLAALARLPKLRALSIAPVCRYEKAGFGPPQWSYPFLAARADRPRVTGKGLRAFAGSTTLERVDLLDVQCESDDLAILTTWPKLSAVSLPNRIDSATARHLQGCKKLNQLTIGHREITAEEIERLAEWKALRRLTVIHAQLPNEALAALSKLTTVEELRLEDCGLTDANLQFLQDSPQLSTLILERNEIDGPGLKHLASLNLKSLGLEFNNLNDDRLPHLAQLKSLEKLSLSYCRNITDGGIRGGILQSMSHVKHLNLRGLKQVTDASLDDLAKFTHLEHVTLRETQVSWDGVAQLQKELPKTVVFK